MKSNIDAILSRMTVEQKVAQLMQLPCSHMTPEEAETWAKRGIGSFLHVFGEQARHLQELAVSSAAGVPLLFGIDAIHGHCLCDRATVFPTQLSMACSFDPALVERVGRAAAKEVAADGLHWTFSPVLCLGRDVRWGRVDETFGEDPYLTGSLGAAIIKGYQGEDNAAAGSILACAKHYIGYGEATGGRDSYDTPISFRKVRDTFLPPFDRAVEAGCATFMTAYGSIDGTPCTADKKLLKTVLKEQLNWNGFIVTDWANVDHLIRDQHVAADSKEASAIALKSGNDMMMNAPVFYDAALELVRDGEIGIPELDDAVRRILTVKERFGLFADPFQQMPAETLGCAEHLELCLQAARESVVLLKNDGTLPLKNKKLCLVGAAADDVRVHYGDWTYFSHPLNRFDAPRRRPFVTTQEGIERLAAEYGCTLTYAEGYTVADREDMSKIDAAVQAAQDADVVLFAFGDDFTRYGENVDVADPRPDAVQRALFARLRELSKPTVAIPVISKPLCIADIVAYSRAVLTVFNGGMFGGQAVAEALFGAINPCGKLPISFPQSVGQMPCYYNQLPGWHRDRYVDSPAQPLFAFGHGLSYTRYTYSDVTFDAAALRLSVTVANVGDFDGKETVQVYFRDVVSSVMTPVKRLIAFRKVALKAGERKTVTFDFTPKDFSFVNADERRVTEAGAFLLFVGSDSTDGAQTQISFTIDTSYVW